MGLIDAVRRVGKKRGDRGGESKRSGKGKRSKGGSGSLPGGASAKEAAETTPQRAAELAD